MASTKISLKGIDWKAPMTDIVDELVDRYLDRYPNADADRVLEWAEDIALTRAAA